MIDLHLINTALAVLGISAGVAVLVAAAIIVIAAIGTRRSAARRGHLAVEQAANPVPREPALR
jgi:hypothetical protein